MSRAEERALEKYPLENNSCDVDSIIAARINFVDGYNQAEKDLELTIDDIMKLDALLIKSWNETKGNPDYKAVLNKFNNERSR